MPSKETAAPLAATPSFASKVRYLDAADVEALRFWSESDPCSARMLPGEYPILPTARLNAFLWSLPLT